VEGVKNMLVINTTLKRKKEERGKGKEERGKREEESLHYK
jgi:hypothetical protein